MLLTVQKPTVSPGQYSATVEFVTGPNLLAYNFEVVCYEQDVSLPTDDCGAVAAAVAAGDLSPLGSTGGTLPRSRSRVAATVPGLPANEDVDCFVQVGGGPIGAVSLCQYAGLTTTNVVPPGPSPSTGTLSVTQTANPTQLLVYFSSQTGREAFLEGSLRNYDVTDQVQCLPSPATECDTSSPDLWTDAPDLYGSGQIVSGLSPNTDYTCFASATYVENGVTQYACAEAEYQANDYVVPTLPGPPRTVEISNPTYQSLNVAAALPDPANGNAVTVQGYAFQCLSTSNECDPDGTWFPSSAFASDPTIPVTVSGLEADTAYMCWAATVVGDSAPFTYACSDPAESSTPAPPLNAPTLDDATHGLTPGTIDVTASSPTGGQANVDAELKVACVPNAVTPPACPVAGDSAWVDATSGLPQAIGSLVAGDEYLCFAAEFATTPADTYRVCSDGTAATASAGPTGTTLFVTDDTSPSVIGGTVAGDGSVTGVSSTPMFDGAAGIAISGTTAYVTNASGDSVTQCTIDGTSLTDCTVMTATGASFSGFNSPYGIAISGTTAYVANIGGNSVTQCTIDGTSLTDCTDLTGATFSAPNGIAINGA